MVQDSYTDGGKHDGSPLAPPIFIPPNPEAGGRSTDGKIWIENIADDIGAKLMDYAVCPRFFHNLPNAEFVSLCRLQAQSRTLVFGQVTLIRLTFSVKVSVSCFPRRLAYSCLQWQYFSISPIS